MKSPLFKRANLDTKNELIDFICEIDPKNAPLIRAQKPTSERQVFYPRCRVLTWTEMDSDSSYKVTLPDPLDETPLKNDLKSKLGILDVKLDESVLKWKLDDTDDSTYVGSAYEIHNRLGHEVHEVVAYIYDCYPASFSIQFWDEDVYVGNEIQNYDDLIDWLLTQGFSITRKDDYETDLHRPTEDNDDD